MSSAIGAAEKRLHAGVAGRRTVADMRQRADAAQEQRGGEIGGRLASRFSRRRMRSATSNATPTIDGHQIIRVDRREEPRAMACSMSSRSSSKPAMTSGVSMRTRVASALWRMVRKFTSIARHELEEGAKGGGDELLHRRGLLALFAQLRADGERRLVADRLVNLFLGFEVVVERARGERRGADDVAHGRGAIAQLGKDAAAPPPG